MAIIYFLQSIYNNTIFIYKKLIISETGASWVWTWNALDIDLSPASGWLWYLAVLPKSPRRPTTQHYFCVSHQVLGLFINGIKWRTAVSNLTPKFLTSTNSLYMTKNKPPCSQDTVHYVKFVWIDSWVTVLIKNKQVTCGCVEEFDLMRFPHPAVSS